MIRVRVGRNRQRQIVWFKASGHSGYAPQGEDIICAGVSAVTLTAVLGLSEYLGMPVDVKTDEEDGLLECHLNHEVAGAKDAQTILETMAFGLQAMAKEYSKYLTFEEVLE